MSTSRNGREGPTSDLESTLTNGPIHNPYVRNIGNLTSLRKAVDAMCAHCMGCTASHMEPGFKHEIRHCSAPHCPLWEFRPYQCQGQEGANSELGVQVAEPVLVVAESENVDSRSLVPPSEASQQ